MTVLLNREQAEKWGHQPGPADWKAVLRTLVLYPYIALATLALGIWGITQIPKGRAGAHRVARVWIGHLLTATRVICGTAVELRGTPPTGAALVAAKHHGFLDILAIAYAVPERGFIMKREVMRVPVMGWYAYKSGCIPIDRAKGGDAMRNIVTELETRRASDEGLGQIIIYPEGTRTVPGTHRPYKHGVATIQARTGLVVHPVAVNCGVFWSKRGFPIRPGCAVIEFLDPMPTGLDERPHLTELRARIETASDALLAEAGVSAPSFAEDLAAQSRKGAPPA